MRLDDRLEALLAQMTLEEKVGQLGIFADMLRPFAPGINPEMNEQDATQTLELVRSGRAGALFNGIGAALGREAQRVAVEETRLGIPLLFGADVIHGMRTVFPIPLGEAASFEPDLARRTARAAAIEATAAGLHWTFAPTVDVARDQRWGRVAEAAGEDVFLSCAFSAARVQGFQGDDLKAEDAMLATPKHFAAYSAVMGGLDYNSVEISDGTLRDVHLPPFKAALDAGALTIMSAFNDINGVPASANRELMTVILRDEWNFRGFVVSDYTADFELIAHGYASDGREATELAFNAGLDMSMQSGLYGAHLASLVQDGKVDTQTLDDSVRRVLSVKDAIGLFDNPYRSLDPQRESALDPAVHADLAREAACRSIVLLKNEGGVLPLPKSGKKIALIGPFAEDRDNLEGCWSLFGDKRIQVNLADGLRAAMPEADELLVVPGCGFEEVIEGGIEAALVAASQADVVLLALGEPQNYSGEAQSRNQIVLPAVQQVLAEAIASTGKPVVVLLRNGRALTLEGAVRDADAIVVTWFLGSQTGTAVADVVFGDFNPSGRLPVSFPSLVGQQPLYYNRARTGRPELPDVTEFKTRWREGSHLPLYPFGHGLSYTRFEYSAPVLADAQLAWDGSLRVHARITNRGECAGEEVVQLYLHDRVASRVRPIRELKGFRKIALPPGGYADVEFVIDRHALSFTRANGEFGAEPGTFDLWIAPSSEAGEAVRFELMAP